MRDSGPLDVIPGDNPILQGILEIVTSVHPSVSIHQRSGVVPNTFELSEFPPAFPGLRRESADGDKRYNPYFSVDVSVVYMWNTSRSEGNLSALTSAVMNIADAQGRD